jgi:hypothetical protein
VPMKVSNDIIGNPHRNLPSCDAVPKISATARLIVQEGYNFISFVQLNMHYRVHSDLPLASLFLSMSAGHNLTFHTFNIHVNFIVASAIIFSTCSFHLFQPTCCVLISYLPSVPHFRPNSSLTQPTVCLELLVIN